jgi:phosphoribosylanthranilate isomerase
MEAPHAPSLIQSFFGPIIKICGITNIDDANLCNPFATHLGLIYADSPRKVSPEVANQILKSVKFTSVGVFMNQNVEFINEQPVDIVQIHSYMSTEDLSKLKRTIWYVVNGILSPLEIEKEFIRVGKLVQCFLLDIPKGSVDRIQFSTLCYLKKQGYFFIVAGGVSSIDAKKYVGFGGIDICSGLECEKGKKDAYKVGDLFKYLNDFDQ